MINYKLMHSFTRNILRWRDDKTALITLHGPLLALSKARCEAVFSSGMLASQAFSMGVMFMFNHKMPLNNPLWFRSFVTSQMTIPFILHALQLHFKTRSGGIEGGGYPILKALFNLCVRNLWIISVSYTNSGWELRQQNRWHPQFLCLFVYSLHLPCNPPSHFSLVTNTVYLQVKYFLLAPARNTQNNLLMQLLKMSKEYLTTKTQVSFLHFRQQLSNHNMAIHGWKLQKL